MRHCGKGCKTTKRSAQEPRRQGMKTPRTAKSQPPHRPKPPKTAAPRTPTKYHPTGAPNHCCHAPSCQWRRCPRTHAQTPGSGPCRRWESSWTRTASAARQGRTPGCSTRTGRPGAPLLKHVAEQGRCQKTRCTRATHPPHHKPLHAVRANMKEAVAQSSQDRRHTASSAAAAVIAASSRLLRQHVRGCNHLPLPLPPHRTGRQRGTSAPARARAGGTQSSPAGPPRRAATTASCASSGACLRGVNVRSCMCAHVQVRVSACMERMHRPAGEQTQLLCRSLTTRDKTAALHGATTINLQPPPATNRAQHHLARLARP